MTTNTTSNPKNVYPKWKPVIDQSHCIGCLNCVRGLSYVSLSGGKPEIAEEKFFLLVNYCAENLFEESRKVADCCPACAFQIVE